MMRKIVACILVLMMILSLTPTAFAVISGVTVDQYEKTVTQGDSAVFIVTVTNDNTGMANGTTFSINGSLTGNFNPDQVSLKRNDVAQTELTFETNGLGPGTYTFSVTATAPPVTEGRNNLRQIGSEATSGTITLNIAELADPDPVTVNGVAIDQEDQTITEGGTVQLSATVNPTDATNKAVTWSSGNTAAATVDSNSGLVTGVAPGTAVIAVTTVDGNFTDTLTITVEESIVNIPVTGVAIDQEDQTITEGGTVHLSATVSPADATNQTMTWSSGTPSVATVDSNSGLVTGVAPGTAVIAVTTVDGNFTDTLTITVGESIVNIPVTGVAIDQEDQTITEGGTVQLSATVNPADATNKAVTWSSGSTAAATVDSSTGLVTGVAPGTAVITVTTEDGSHTASVNITVEAPPPPTSLSYVALGDSLVTGTTGISGTMTSYVHGFRSFLQNQYDLDVLLTNLAADGDASGHLLAKLDQPDFAATVAAADVITLAIGGNNVMPAARESGFWSIDHAMAEAGTSAFENEYSLIINRIHELNPNADLIVMTLYNPYNSANQPTRYSGDTVLHAEAAAYISRINQQIFAHAGSGNYSIADVHAAFLSYAAQGKMGDITYFYPAYSWWTWFIVRNTRDPHPNQAGQNLMRSLHESLFNEFSSRQTEYPVAA